ncbi:sensor domain-containing diguanylate cyclase [Shewanella mesophila]|uniref:sensor domain-containing diguanylate cyclase n=1 Tax=Shewanella mesophila TaxID=2864208 RepID=UPI001C65D759|nr:sensor domain-containing diguanylate cyclase [Shewanella mesophila]QYJ85298.1 sensor domain-containing diguanylate cyclase [Shewanella mesophila]
MENTYKHNTLAESDITLNAILDLIAEGTWDWNANTGIVIRSPGWYRMLGYDEKSLQENVFTWENIIHPDDYNRVMTHFEQYINGESNQYRIEYRCKKSDDTYLWILDHAKIQTYKADGTVARMIGVHQNIHDEKLAAQEADKLKEMAQKGTMSLENLIKINANELKLKNQQLEDKIKQVALLSNIDPLTSIANRRSFEVELTKEILRSKRYNHPLSLAIFDIDLFKNINDTYGHNKGDLILQKLCRLVSKNIREQDCFARWGGEEFVIIFPEITLENALEVTEKLRSTISQYEFEPNLYISCSFGVTECNSTDSIEAVFQRIDNSLYQAKRNGRNRIESG